MTDDLETESIFLKNFAKLDQNLNEPNNESVKF